MSWTGCKTPPPGKTMSYTVAVPYFTDIDLGRMCSHVHPDLPAQSCVIAVDRTVRGRPVRSPPCRPMPRRHDAPVTDRNNRAGCGFWSLIAYRSARRRWRCP